MGQAKRREGKPPKGDGYKRNQVTRFVVDYAKDSEGRPMVAIPSWGKVFRTGPKFKIPGRKSRKR